MELNSESHGSVGRKDIKIYYLKQLLGYFDFLVQNEKLWSQHHKILLRVEYYRVKHYRVKRISAPNIQPPLIPLPPNVKQEEEEQIASPFKVYTYSTMIRDYR